MGFDQAALSAILVAMLAGFVAGRWRYDIVAMAGLMTAVALRLVPAEAAFAGFANPAVVTVAGVLVLSRTLTRSNRFDAVAERLLGGVSGLTGQLLVLCGLAALASAFMNNIGALALFMPVALWAARRYGRSPALYLMPLSYATLLGGMVTLIGTPANLLVSRVRAGTTGEPFGMFAFTPVAAPLTLLGVCYLAVAVRVLRPPAGTGRKVAQEANDGEAADDAPLYDTELVVAPSSPFVGRPVAQLERERNARVYGILRCGRRLFGRMAEQALQAHDILLLRVGVAALPALAASDGLIPPGAGTADGVEVEAVVAPNAIIQGSCAATLDLEGRFGVTLVAAMRQQRRAEGRLADASLSVGDVLLLHGEPEAVRTAAADLGCLLLADRGSGDASRHGAELPPRRAAIAALVFIVAVLLAALEIGPIAVVFSIGVLVLVAARCLRPPEIYEAIDWPVIVLLAAVIPLGDALQNTGTAGQIAALLLHGAGGSGPHAMLTLLLGITMLLTPVLNNPATVVVMSPVALGLANGLGVSPDPFLIAVAIGASCDFLTPFGHHNNTLVMGIGGYRFADFARLGLGLDLLVILAGSLLIPLVWRF
ncbi:SLC13 family permease [Azospirillum picis]|uniref:Di/tricarboxylate transporter n=1 Tax=Azospirillum picis TaxID=488438 RepID=A0ABU0MN24_9PROT|nr:SLC13 family permease [Azospirillum picis]MBP2301170.1 di/tricarboxylate transporter [Azospirillum picis]MDQ0534868.1 di/tricarboxylate transporter [Azospirillum picis]